MEQTENIRRRVSETGATPRRVLDDLTVIIPTVGRPILQRCLQSIAVGTVLPARIIAIDQGDNPAVADWLHGLEEIGLETFHLPSTERSPASARNRGIEQVQTPFVASVDDDCIVEKDWLENIERLLHQHPMAIITGRVEPAGDGMPLSVVTSTVPCVHRRSSVRIINPMPSGNMGFALRTALRIGPFDENLPTAEDIDWGYRALRIGVPIIYAPEIVVYHCHCRNEAQTVTIYRAYAWGLGAFYGKHLRRGDWSMLLRIAISLYRAVTSIISGVLNKDYSKRAVGRSRLTFLLPGLVVGLRGRGLSKMSLPSRNASSSSRS
ncbi:MAG: glycosyltransferase [Syntrophobacteraceae bacterium]|jgi:GT2 family glycosyltransferase